MGTGHEAATEAAEQGFDESEFERALVLSQCEADEREGAVEWAIAFEAAERRRADGGRGGGSPPYRWCAAPGGMRVVCMECMDALGPPSHVLIPCGHVCVCAACAERCTDTTRECPICREPVREAFRAFGLPTVYGF